MLHTVQWKWLLDSSTFSEILWFDVNQITKNFKLVNVRACQGSHGRSLEKQLWGRSVGVSNAALVGFCSGPSEVDSQYGSFLTVRQVLWIRHLLAKQGTDRFLSGSSELCPNSLTRKGWGRRRPSVPSECLSEVANAPSCFPSWNGHYC